MYNLVKYVRALSQLSFVQFQPYASLFPRLLLTLTLMREIRKTLEKRLNLTPLFEISVDSSVEGLVSNVDYLENCCCNFIPNKYAGKRRLQRTHVLFSER